MAAKEKSVQIPEKLFAEIGMYFLLDRREESLENAIKAGLNEKIEATVRHELYTRYKTAATPEQQEAARRDYLDRVGISTDFRWD
jgi:hypothetical protein